MPELEPFDAADRDTVFDRDVVDYDAVVARLSSLNPDVPVSRIQTLVRHEDDALAAGAPRAVAAGTFEGVQELIDRGEGAADR